MAEGGTCPPKLVMHQNKEEEEKTEDMDDLTNEIFTQRDNPMAPNPTIRNQPYFTLLNLVSQCQMVVI